MPEATVDVDRLPVVSVPVSSLSLGFSPRIAGHDEQTVRTLAQLDQVWPPLLVHRGTNRVIDGMHRLLAARLRGDRTIDVRLHDCDESDAFVLAVSMNVMHGLPLSLSDRKAAAGRIIGIRPTWSDRRIATVAGLSDKTVAAIRRVGTAIEGPREERRIGSDGRSRPVDAAVGRATVTRLLAERPEASLRHIAEQAGVSPETVRAIRSTPRDRADSATKHKPRRSRTIASPRRCLNILVGDPALRSTEAGRALLRILSTLTLIHDRPNLIEAVPNHDLPAFRQLAIANAEAWQVLARLADGRSREVD
jgi:ParB-like chromosome segregation protein Spo0J